MGGSQGGSNMKSLMLAVLDSLTNSAKKYIGYVLLVPLLVAGALAYTYYSQYQLFKNNPQAATAKVNQQLVAEVGRLIFLPDEQPTVATVSDLESLKNQPFFAQAKIGDKVLIYTNAKKAVLYDPDAKKIVEVAPLNTANNNPQTGSQQWPNQTK